MCDNGLNFDIYVDIDHCDSRVEFNDLDDRVEIVLGDERVPRGHCLNLWCREPDMVVDIGRRMVDAGEKFLAQRADLRERLEQTRK